MVSFYAVSVAVADDIVHNGRGDAQLMVLKTPDDCLDVVQRLQGEVNASNRKGFTDECVTEMIEVARLRSLGKRKEAQTYHGERHRSGTINLSWDTIRQWYEYDSDTRRVVHTRAWATVPFSYEFRPALVEAFGDIPGHWTDDKKIQNILENKLYCPKEWILALFEPSGKVIRPQTRQQKEQREKQQQALQRGRASAQPRRLLANQAHNGIPTFSGGASSMGQPGGLDIPTHLNPFALLLQQQQAGQAMAFQRVERERQDRKEAEEKIDREREKADQDRKEAEKEARAQREKAERDRKEAEEKANKDRKEAEEKAEREREKANQERKEAEKQARARERELQEKLDQQKDALIASLLGDKAALEKKAQEDQAAWNDEKVAMQKKAQEEKKEWNNEKVTMQKKAQEDQAAWNEDKKALQEKAQEDLAALQEDKKALQDDKKVLQDDKKVLQEEKKKAVEKAEEAQQGAMGQLQQQMKDLTIQMTPVKPAATRPRTRPRRSTQPPPNLNLTTPSRFSSRLLKFAPPPDLGGAPQTPSRLSSPILEEAEEATPRSDNTTTKNPTDSMPLLELDDFRKMVVIGKPAVKGEQTQLSSIDDWEKLLSVLLKLLAQYPGTTAFVHGTQAPNRRSEFMLGTQEPDSRLEMVEVHLYEADQKPPSILFRKGVDGPDTLFMYRSYQLEWRQVKPRVFILALSHDEIDAIKEDLPYLRLFIQGGPDQVRLDAIPFGTLYGYTIRVPENGEEVTDYIHNKFDADVVVRSSNRAFKTKELVENSYRHARDEDGFQEEVFEAMVEAVTEGILERIREREEEVAEIQQHVQEAVWPSKSFKVDRHEVLGLNKENLPESRAQEKKKENLPSSHAKQTGKERINNKKKEAPAAKKENLPNSHGKEQKKKSPAKEVGPGGKRQAVQNAPIFKPGTVRHAWVKKPDGEQIQWEYVYAASGPNTWEWLPVPGRKPGTGKKTAEDGKNINGADECKRCRKDMESGKQEWQCPSQRKRQHRQEEYQFVCWFLTNYSPSITGMHS